MNALSPTIGSDIAEEASLSCLAFAVQRVDAAFQHNSREARRHSGGSYSGMDGGPVEPPTCRDHIAAAEASSARRAEMDESLAWKAKVAADALCKRFFQAAQEAENLKNACDRADGSGTAKLNALTVLANELHLACSDAFLAVYDADHAGGRA
ncbi:MAG TPA: hypothetical protein VIO94_15775 [Phenylobacterium sp.]